LDNLQLFKGTQRLVKAFKDAYEATSRQLQHQTLCKLICKGYAEDGKLPVFDFWPMDNENDRLPRLTEPQASYNLLMASNCIQHWSSELKVRYSQLESNGSMVYRMEWDFSFDHLFQSPGEVFVGNVAYCDEEALVSVHLQGKGDDDTYAVYMEAYLRTLKLAVLQSRFPCMSKESAEKGLRDGLIYVAEFADDESLYRARILEAGQDSVSFLINNDRNFKNHLYFI